MPFMKGPAPIRRTLKYLESGKLILKDRVQVLSINYNSKGKHHAGARDFVFWHLPQLQYKNPNVQVVTFKNMTPSPFVRCFYDNGDDLLIDIDSQNREDILNHLISVVGKSKKVLQMEMRIQQKIDNPANFGYGCRRHCLCEVPGQVPCPSVVPLPKHMMGKYIYAKDN
ncbi:small ribosomal subunit protein mS25 [Halyomorpha halys]|uniref:small ribosomal subunit protein mS25 n=1 Tax=Halyomorpha halys TaxID=286706 RepID=UPI0006D51AC3|nr:probable 28S ribosomal protein S25, mitochondrial [Halyomorpha halys]